MTYIDDDLGGLFEDCLRWLERGRLGLVTRAVSLGLAMMGLGCPCTASLESRRLSVSARKRT